MFDFNKPAMAYLKVAKHVANPPWKYCGNWMLSRKMNWLFIDGYWQITFSSPFPEQFILYSHKFAKNYVSEWTGLICVRLTRHVYLVFTSEATKLWKIPMQSFCFRICQKKCRWYSWGHSSRTCTWYITQRFPRNNKWWSLERQYCFNREAETILWLYILSIQ